MRKVLALVLLINFVSCSKKDSPKLPVLTPEVRQQKIDAALNKKNPNRLIIANKILLNGPSSNRATLKEVIGIDKSTGRRSIAYLVIEKMNDVPILNIAAPVGGWGIYTGWMLGSDGCWQHGTFAWSGNPTNYIFNADLNPYGDGNIGNEPRCMNDEEFDAIC